MCPVQQFILQIKGIRVLGWPTFPAKISSSGARGCRQAISTMDAMALPVMEFQGQGYKIRKIFA